MVSKLSITSEGSIVFWIWFYCDFFLFFAFFLTIPDSFRSFMIGKSCEAYWNQLFFGDFFYYASASGWFSMKDSEHGTRAMNLFVSLRHANVAKITRGQLRNLLFTIKPNVTKKSCPFFVCFRCKLTFVFFLVTMKWISSWIFFYHGKLDWRICLFFALCTMST